MVTNAVTVPEKLTRTTLEAALHECRGCDLYRDATQVVPGEGRLRSRLILVGEQPGDHEDLAGEPFVGPAGRVLDRALDRAGIDRGDVFTTNAVKHFRFRTVGKRRIHQGPTRTQVVACRPWLLAELALVRPSGIVLLGGTAGKALYGNSFRIGSSRGQLLPWPEDIPITHPPDWVSATIHPSAVLRAEDREAMFAGLVDDLVVARDALTRPGYDARH